jgi:hypothetical protein
MDTAFLRRFTKYFRYNYETGAQIKTRHQVIQVERQKQKVKNIAPDRGAAWCHYVCLAEVDGLIGLATQVSRMGQLRSSGWSW